VNPTYAIAGAVLALSVAASAFLALAWPFVVSADRDDPVFRILAIATLIVFFAALIVLCAFRIRARR
jgi:hypothetical protein